MAHAESTHHHPTCGEAARIDAQQMRGSPGARLPERTEEAAHDDRG